MSVLHRFGRPAFGQTDLTERQGRVDERRPYPGYLSGQLLNADEVDQRLAVPERPRWR